MSENQKSIGQELEIGDEVLADGRIATVKMIGLDEVRVKHENGNMKTLPKNQIKTDYQDEDLDGSILSVDFIRYTDKKSGAGKRQTSPQVRISKESIHFNKAAVEIASLDAYHYVNYMLSNNPDIFAVKPVKNGGVDENSYKLNNGSVSFSSISRELGLRDLLRYTSSEKLNAKWDSDNDMFIIDISELRNE